MHGERRRIAGQTFRRRLAIPQGGAAVAAMVIPAFPRDLFR